MAGARTEAGPTGAEADTRTGAARTEAAGRVIRAAEGDISAPADRAEVARISVAAEAVADSVGRGRRVIHRRRGRVAARTEARRHASRAAIRLGLTAAEALGARVEAMAAHLAARVDRVMAAEDTETLDMETRAATVGQLTPETTDRMAAHDKEALTAARSKANVAAHMATLIATVPQRIRVTDATVVTARPQIAATRV
jgi:hypothetical protein